MSLAYTSIKCWPKYIVQVTKKSRTTGVLASDHYSKTVASEAPTSVSLKDLAAFLDLAPEDERVRGVWQGQGTQSQDDSRDSSKSQGQPPSPVCPDCTVVDAGSCQDTEDTEALEEQVEGSPPPWWRNF